MLYLSLLAESHYEKVRAANLTSSLAWNSLAKGRYFPVKPIVKKELALFVNIDEQMRRKQKHTSFLTAF